MQRNLVVGKGRAVLSDGIWRYGCHDGSDVDDRREVNAVDQISIPASDVIAEEATAPPSRLFGWPRG